MYMNAEMHIFIIWNKARKLENKIMNDISKNFIVLGKTEIIWGKEFFSNNLSAFYGEKLPKGCNKEKEVGRGPFQLIYVLDENPLYRKRRVNSGNNIVDVNVFDSKEMYRVWLKSHNIHSSNTLEEVDHDLYLLLGMHATEVKERLERGEHINNYVREIKG